MGVGTGILLRDRVSLAVAAGRMPLRLRIQTEPGFIAESAYQFDSEWDFDPDSEQRDSFTGIHSDHRTDIP